MNKHVDAIECRRNCVKLRRGCVQPILARNSNGSLAKTHPVDKRRDPNDTAEVENQRKPHGGKTFNQAYTVQLTESIMIPPMSQMAAQVVSTAAVLVYLEPKAVIQQRHRVRTANGIADIKTNERLAITFSNSSKTPNCLPKGTVVAYVKRNPLAFQALPDKASRAPKSVLHLPLERTKGANDTDGTQPIQPQPSEGVPPDWLRSH